MSRAKRRIVAALLVAFAVWPLLHHGLVGRYGLDRWRFAGWSMYTAPKYIPKVEVFELRDGARVKIPLTGSRLEAAAATHEHFRMEALSWGRLAIPDVLASQVRAGLATREPIEIVITRFFLDPRSARVSATRESFFYPANAANAANAANGANGAVP